MKITKIGKVTITDDGVYVEDFTFYGDPSKKGSASKLAIKWAMKQLRIAKKLSKHNTHDKDNTQK